jgi:hypothetical protein
MFLEFGDEDAGSRFKAVIYPFDENGTRLVPKESNWTPTIKPRGKAPVKISGIAREGEKLRIETTASTFAISFSK